MSGMVDIVVNHEENVLLGQFMIMMYCYCWVDLNLKTAVPGQGLHGMIQNSKSMNVCKISEDSKNWGICAP